MKRQQIRKILENIVLFIKAIGLLTWKVVKQIILPNRQRKGNILSSILLLFISLTDLVTTFSWGFSLKFIVRWKHYDRAVGLVKKSVLLTGCLFFLLSSFEWSYHTPLALKETSPVVQTEQQPIKAAPRYTIAYHCISLIHIYPKRISISSTERLYSRSDTYSTTSKIYLQNCNFRI